MIACKSKIGNHEKIVISFIFLKPEDILGLDIPMPSPVTLSVVE
jgi:hypothetical protein